MKRRGKRREMMGVVLNNTMDKTVKVLVERLAKHKKYRKYIRYRAKYLVHDTHNRCQIGDKVRIIESRPTSKLKKWRVLEILD
ncbi:MAG: 30S ribosomal protein S17 [Desulfobacteraceae bacterium]|jgi:small subunit ribosomal protein S17|nr:MAG: 30S ribosomal protein S17 [Deltaproteobacteria bacterium]TET94876.1 MAG: 30S ribosomal protein S17 [Desulfobacteraceae bacterium]